jgi:hypothetical protein
MHKRSSTTRDINEMAFKVIDRATEIATPKKRRKNPAAVMLGRRGGLKGGKARAAALSAEERRAIAKKAAEARWTRMSEEE